MKSFRNISLTLIGLLLYTVSSAQLPTIEVFEEMANMSRGENHAFVMMVSGGEPKDVEKEIRKAFKGYKAKVDGNYKEEILFDDANIKSISDNTIDLYLRLDQISTDVKLVAFFDLGGIYLSSETHESETEIAMTILEDFGMQYQRLLVERKLAAEEDVLKDMEKSLEKMIKDEEKKIDDIKKAERDIERTKTDIQTNLVDQERKDNDIDTQKDVIRNMADALGDDEKKEAEKTLKGLEKEADKLDKDNEKMHKKIQDMDNEIEDNDRAIDKLREEQEKKRDEIFEQKEVVSKVRDHLGEFPSPKK
jgi:myosin heavy subunit